MDIPLFLCGDIYGWVNKVELYFQVGGVPDRDTCCSHGGNGGLSIDLVSIMGILHSES